MAANTRTTPPPSAIFFQNFIVSATGRGTPASRTLSDYGSSDYDPILVRPLLPSAERIHLLIRFRTPESSLQKHRVETRLGTRGRRTRTGNYISATSQASVTPLHTLGQRPDDSPPGMVRILFNNSGFARRSR